MLGQISLVGGPGFVPVPILVARNAELTYVLVHKHLEECERRSIGVGAER